MSEHGTGSAAGSVGVHIVNDTESAMAPLHPPLDETTFEYLRPTEAQIAKMGAVREAAAHYAKILQDIVPEGADKTYLMRKLREVAMWANVAITRHADGKPRTIEDP